MKRFLLWVLAIGLLAGVSTSCKSYEDCPAYGNVESVEVVKV